MPRQRNRPPLNQALGEWGALLARVRTARGLTQEDAGQKAGLSHQWVSEVEGGLLDPPLTKVAALLRELDSRLEVRSAVAPEVAITEALKADTTLTAEDRGDVIDFYQLVRRRRSRPRRRASGDR